MTSSSKLASIRRPSIIISKARTGCTSKSSKLRSRKLKEHAGFDPEKLKALSREEALRSFVSQQLRPLLFRDEMSRYIRLFAGESAHPSKIFLKFMATNTVSYLTTAVDIVRRFLPPATQKRVALSVALWLLGQCSVFVRNRELIAQEPFSITADEPFTDELTELITRLAIGGLLHAAA